MEHIPLSQTDTGLHIEGFPDAVKVVQIDGPKAKRLADLALHRSDLQFADACLDTINTVPGVPDVLREALWRSAIVHFVKCFGGASARFQLSAERIYKGEPEGLVAFRNFRDLRNKHFVHDENSYSQSLPGAVLNKGDKEYKVEKIVCLRIRGETLKQGTFSDLKLLVSKARAWVVSEFDALCSAVTQELERESYEALANRKALTFQAPTADEIGNRRAT
jgi:hypothetical protein